MYRRAICCNWLSLSPDYQVDSATVFTGQSRLCADRGEVFQHDVLCLFQHVHIASLIKHSTMQLVNKRRILSRVYEVQVFSEKAQVYASHSWQRTDAAFFQCFTSITPLLDKQCNTIAPAPAELWCET